MAENANYPFAMAKYLNQPYEVKGRTNSNEQDFRHDCVVEGGKSKCNICEDIDCASTKDASCFLQLQGVDSGEMSVNVPTITDTAWAVGGTHRKDYGGSTVTHFCVFLSGDDCVLPTTIDFSSCKLRCFGYFGYLGNGVHPAKLGSAAVRTITDQYPGMQKWAEDGLVDLWQYPRNCDELLAQQNVACTYTQAAGNTNLVNVPSFNPQGYVFTYSGHGDPGFVDGASNVAKFQSPDDLVMDQNGFIYVADTKNNAIRMVNQDGSVITLAGKGPLIVGAVDGPCTDATFTEPRGIDVEIRTVLGVEITVIVIAGKSKYNIKSLKFSILLASYVM